MVPNALAKKGTGKFLAALVSPRGAKVCKSNIWADTNENKRRETLRAKLTKIYRKE